MSKKNIEAYIPQVMAILHKTFSDGVIPSSYNGYISSFGASVIQSGLLPTLALFEDTNASTKEKKESLIYIIIQVLTQSQEDRSLLQYALGSKDTQLKQKILDISVATKLCIRTFKLDKGDKGEPNE